MKNTPGTFQPVMNVVLFIVHCQFPLAYPDDNRMLLENEEAHIKVVRHILTLFVYAGVAIKLKMGNFLKQY